MNIRINEESNVTQQQVVGFSDQNQQWTYSVDNRLDDVHRTTDSNDADLNNFFSRPIKIASLNWTVGATFGTTINPWQLYFENTRVINRISNYHLLRSKLCVRIMINGNGFHYGRALASYRPLHNEDDYLAWRFIVPQDAIAASQRMHVWIDPTKSQGGTLCLPYVYYKNAMNIVEQDWRNMGELDIGSLTTLQHANGGTDSVTVSVFAWAEDVSLSIPTIAEPGSLSPQGGVEDDEYDQGTGPISGPAAAIARTAGVLSNIPQIKPFALATQMAASTTGNIAKLFGMSRPVDTTGIASYKPTYAGNMANSNVLDTSTKLTYDAKQELTIDPVACGMGPSDEMSLVSIAKRESYVTQFPWSTSDVPETMLWNTNVTPTMLAVSGAEIHMTPMAFVSTPFMHWRGSINYRFQIVASAFHKGRIKIVYEPYLAAAGATEYNTQYTHVIDLAKERDFTVTVNWGQEFSYLETLSSSDVIFSTSPLGSALHGAANGKLYVSVVNDLTTPSSVLSDVSILVSCSAGDDFEVVNPHDRDTTLTYLTPQAGGVKGTREYWEYMKNYVPQGGLDNADNDLTTGEAAPVSMDVETSLATALSTSDNTQKIYFGDPVTSIRQLLKRYEYYTNFPQLSDLANYYSQYTVPDFPLIRGYAGATGSMNNAATPVDPTPYNFVNGILLTWFTPAFLCRRGGIRWKYVLTGGWGADAAGVMSVKRDPRYTFWTQSVYDTSSAGTTSQRTLSQLDRGLDGHSGMHATPTIVNPVVEIELPFQTNIRFAPARRKADITAGSTLKFDKYHELRFPSLVNSTGGVAAYVSVGEDFSLSFFQAVPICYVQATPAASTVA
jgi:hypothetical protein